MTFLKECSQTLLRHHYITTQNFGVYFSIFKKVKQISIERWPAINVILDGSRVLSNQKGHVLPLFGRRQGGQVPEHAMHPCLSALAESSSGRCGTFLCYCWMMLRVDGYLNEGPGPLPGPRLTSAN